MFFEWPAMLYSLVLVPLLAGMYLVSWRRRSKRLAALGGFGMPQSGNARPGLRRHIPPMLFMAAFAALTVALARPQSVVSLPSVEGTVVLVFDVSGSMTAKDIEPSRLEAAKAAALGFVEQQPASVQIGIVAFSDGGLTVLTPTNDKQAIVEAVKRLSPQRASSVGSGIEIASEVILRSAGHEEYMDQPPTVPPAEPFGVIVLLTDGENNMAPDPLEVAHLASQVGVRIDTIGIGSPEGQTLEINGYMVHTQLDEESLKQIAQLSGGTYFNARSPGELQKIYQGIQPRLVIEEQTIEVTSLFAALGMLILLLGGAFSLLWFGRVP